MDQCKNCKKFKHLQYLDWCKAKMCPVRNGGEGPICTFERYARVTRKVIKELKEKNDYLQKEWYRLANFQLHVLFALGLEEKKDPIEEINRLKENEKVILELRLANNAQDCYKEEEETDETDNNNK